MFLQEPRPYLPYHGLYILLGILENLLEALSILEMEFGTPTTSLRKKNLSLRKISTSIPREIEMPISLIMVYIFL